MFFDKKTFTPLTSKTPASRRVLSLDNTTLSLLKKQRTEQSRGVVQPIGYNDDRMIFTREDGTPKEVQKCLGHSDIKITMNIYTHVTKAVIEKNADLFEKFTKFDPPIAGSDVVTNDQE